MCQAPTFKPTIDYAEKVDYVNKKKSLYAKTVLYSKVNSKLKSEPLKSRAILS